MWNWTCDKFLSFNYSGLDVVENSYPVCRKFCRFLLAYGLGHILFVSLENVFKFSTILGSVSISKQLNRACWNREQESDQDCRKVAHGGGVRVGLKEFEPDVYAWRPEFLFTDLTWEAFNEPLISSQFNL